MSIDADTQKRSPMATVWHSRHTRFILPPSPLCDNFPNLTLMLFDVSLRTGDLWRRVKYLRHLHCHFRLELPAILRLAAHGGYIHASAAQRMHHREPLPRMP